MEKAPLLSFFSYFCMQKIKNSNEITMNILELSEQEIVRRQCLQELKEMGINPYPAAEFPTNAFSVDIKKAFDADEEKREVVIAGRMMSRRIMGKASFMELQDSRGRIQVYISRDDICPGDDKDLYNKVFKKLLDIGDFVGVKGFVFRTQTGEVSVHAQELTLLSKSLKPLPIVKYKDGVAYDPSCVQHIVRVDESNLSKGLVFGVLNVQRREIVWLEMPYTSQTMLGVDAASVETLLKRLEEKTTVGELLEIRAEAQGATLVGNESDAEERYTYQWALNTAEVSRLLLG